MARYGQSEVSKPGMVRLLELLGRAASLAAEGEMLDVALSRRGDIKIEEYVEVIEKKTGALFAASAASGAVVAGAEDDLVGAMYELGLSLGIAFQIGDDILDMSGDTRSMGKPRFKDIENNAGNVVLLHARSKADAIQRTDIDSFLLKKWLTSLDAARLIGIFKETGSFEYAASLLNVQTARCRGLLQLLPASHAKDALHALTRTIEIRRD